MKEIKTIGEFFRIMATKRFSTCIHVIDKKLWNYLVFHLGKNISMKKGDEYYSLKNYTVYINFNDKARRFHTESSNIIIGYPIQMNFDNYSEEYALSFSYYIAKCVMEGIYSLETKKMLS